MMRSNDFPKRRPEASDQTVRRFARVVRGAMGKDAVFAALTRAADRLGFAYVALVSHGAPAEAQLWHHNYPSDWAALYEWERLDRHDPVRRLCRGRLTGFSWRRLATNARLSDAEREVLRRSGQYGLGDGYTVPLHLPGVRESSCSFALDPGQRLPRSALLVAQPIAQLAFEAMLRHLPARPIRLTARERECIVLLGAGLTDREIGRRLGLSEETITKYLNAARRRNGFRRRGQLLVAALRDGEIAADPEPDLANFPARVGSARTAPSSPQEEMDSSGLIDAPSR